MADEKKENGFSKLFKKIGKSITDSTREDKLSRAFRNKAHVQDFTIYTDDSSLLSLKEYFGILDDGKKEVTLYGDINDNDVPYSSILSTKTESSNELPRRFYLLERRVENIDIELEEKDENDNVIIMKAHGHIETIIKLLCEHDIPFDNAIMMCNLGLIDEYVGPLDVRKDTTYFTTVLVKRDSD